MNKDGKVVSMLYQILAAGGDRKSHGCRVRAKLFESETPSREVKLRA